MERIMESIFVWRFEDVVAILACAIIVVVGVPLFIYGKISAWYQRRRLPKSQYFERKRNL